MRIVLLALFGTLIFSLALAVGMAIFGTVSIANALPRSGAEVSTWVFALVATIAAVALMRRAMY